MEPSTSMGDDTAITPYPDEPHPDDRHAWECWWVKKFFAPSAPLYL